MSDETAISTADTMRERSNESRLRIWFLLRANRVHIAAILTGLVFIVAVTILYPPFVRQIESGDTIETMFSTMLSIIVTGTTLVVTISQLVISQEKGPLGDQRERMSNAMDFRDFTEELIGSPSLPDPSEFRSQIVEITSQRAETLGEEIDDNENEQLHEEVSSSTASPATPTRSMLVSTGHHSGRSMSSSPP